MSVAGTDLRRMRDVLALAALGEGTTRPNPRVGCVVARDGDVVGVGWHRTPGGPHAEVEALDAAGDAARGATLYVNLEPCAHHGRTPPCIDRIVAGGIARVVASVQDPNPLVDGRGFRRLRESGIEVEVGLLGGDARALNAPFFHWHETGRPWVTLKTAASLDGRTTADAGRSRWITGAVARRFAHRLRLRHEAIAVGAGTVREDDPALDVRLPGVDAPPPTRIVLVPSGDVAPTARVFRDDGARVLVYVREGVGRVAHPRAETVPVGWSDDGGLDLRAVVADLGARGVQSVLVEGGARTAGRFFEADLVDAVAAFQAPTLVGARGGRPVLDGRSVASPAEAPRLTDVRRLALGEDVVTIARVRRSGDPEGTSCSPD